MSMLQVSNLSKSFGGVHAVQDVSFSVPEGSVYSVIGPNGAGKTTLFNLITGVYVPDGGTLRLKGVPIEGRKTADLAKMGVARTFQNLQICMNMSALENVMVGAHLRLDRNLLKAAFRLPSLARRDRELAQEASDLMVFVGLKDKTRADADSFSYGMLKRLEIARALALKPRIIFLDEPAAGLNPRETDEVAELIREISGSGITVVLVEHDMKMVMKLSDHILVMDYGKTLAEGSPEEVCANPAVIAAYLGVQA